MIFHRSQPAARSTVRPCLAILLICPLLQTGCSILHPALSPVADQEMTNGLEYRYYEGTWGRIPNFANMPVIQSGAVETFDLSPGRRADYFGIVFTGFIEVPANGIYTFYAACDESCAVSVGPVEVLHYDGLPALRRSSGQITLKSGKHPIKVQYYETTGPERIEISYSGPNIPRQPVPRASLWRIAPADETEATPGNS